MLIKAKINDNQWSYVDSDDVVIEERLLDGDIRYSVRNKYNDSWLGVISAEVFDSLIREKK